MMFGGARRGLVPLDEYLEILLGGVSLHDFKSWAFGEDYDDSQVPLVFMEAWNVRHKEELELHPDSGIYGDLDKMVELYRKRLCENG